VRNDHVVIEPCSGFGNLVDALDAAWPLATYESADANPARPRPCASAFHFVGDFLAQPNGWAEPGLFEGKQVCVVTNPPFSTCQRFAEQAKQGAQGDDEAQVRIAVVLFMCVSCCGA
jgi:hypothetical protein